MNRQREVNEYLDGRLTPRNRSAFESRLAEDPSLAAELRETRRVVDLLQQLPAETTPRRLLAGVMAEVRAESAPVALPWLRWLDAVRRPPKLALAAATVLVLVGAQVALKDDVRPLELSVADAQFVAESLQDYHYQVAASLSRDNAEAGQGTPATLEF